MMSLLSFSPEQIEFGPINKSCSLFVKNNSEKSVAFRVYSLLTANFIIKPQYNLLPPKKEKLINIAIENAIGLDHSKQHKILIDFIAITYPSSADEKDIKDLISKATLKEKKSINVVFNKSVSSTSLKAESSEHILTKFKIKGLQKDTTEKPKTEEKIIDIDLPKRDKKVSQEEYDKVEKLYKQVISDNSQLLEANTTLQSKNKIFEDDIVQMQQKISYMESVEKQLSQFRTIIDKYEKDAIQSAQKIANLENANNKSELELSRIRISLKDTNRKFEALQEVHTNTVNEFNQWKIIAVPNQNALKPIRKYIAAFQIAQYGSKINSFERPYTLNKSSLIRSSKCLSNISIKASPTNRLLHEASDINFAQQSIQMNGKAVSERVSALNDELSICKEQMRSLIENNLDAQKQIDTLKEANKASICLIDTLKGNMKINEVERQKIILENSQLLEKFNSVLKQGIEIKNEAVKASEDNLRSLFRSIGELLNKPVAHLTNLEKIVISYECGNRLKPLLEHSNEIIVLIGESMDLWSKNLQKVQRKSIKVADLYDKVFRLESGDKAEVAASIKYLKENIKYLKVNAACTINEESTNSILLYLQEKKKHVADLSKEASEIEKIMSGFSRVKTKFQGISDSAKQKLQKFSALVYFN